MPPRSRNLDAGPAARRLAYPGSAADAAGGHARVAAETPGDHAGIGPRPRRRHSRLRPSATRVFLAVSAVLAAAFDAAIAVRRARRGPWRAEVAEGSMAPALQPGDWLLLDPTCRRWPRPGTIVVVREPGTGVLAIKRVAVRGRRGDRGFAHAPALPDGVAPQLPDGAVPPLGSREAWVLGDARGGSIDSRAYGPLDADALVARAWLRYGPPRRIGRLR